MKNVFQRIKLLIVLVPFIILLLFYVTLVFSNVVYDISILRKIIIVEFVLIFSLLAYLIGKSFYKKRKIAKKEILKKLDAIDETIITIDEIANQTETLFKNSKAKKEDIEVLSNKVNLLVSQSQKEASSMKYELENMKELTKNDSKKIKESYKKLSENISLTLELISKAVSITNPDEIPKNQTIRQV